MKRTFPVFLALLLLAGCGKAKEIDPAVLGPKLLEEAGFPDTMTELAEDMLPVVWQIDVSALESSYAAISGGATAEELLLLRAESEEDAKVLYDQLAVHLKDRTESFVAYLPEEAGKLEDAILERYGPTVVLCVCGDPDAARSLLE